jgi:hypothetical protein
MLQALAFLNQIHTAKIRLRTTMVATLNGNFLRLQMRWL